MQKLKVHQLKNSLLLLKNFKEFNVNSQLLSKLQCADVNPLIELRLTTYEELKEAGMPIPTELETTSLPPSKIKPTVVKVVPLWAYVVMIVLTITTVVMEWSLHKNRMKF